LLFLAPAFFAAFLFSKNLYRLRPPRKAGH
jgi:hypothetical protein